LHLPLDGDNATGFAKDYGGGWTHSGAFGVNGGGGGRMYMLNDWRAGSWGAASYRKFNLLGKTVAFEVDLSGVGCGILACLYLSAMRAPGPNGANYCDIMPSSGGCFELDLMEANMLGYEVSLHTHPGSAFDGSCNEKGCSTNVGRYPYSMTEPHPRSADLYGPGKYIDTRSPFKVVASMAWDGALTVWLRQADRELEVYNRTSAWNVPEVYDYNNRAAYPAAGGIPAADLAKVPPAMEQGLTLVTSLWTTPNTRWLDMTACGGEDAPHADLDSAHFTVWGLTVFDTVAPAVADPMVAADSEARVPLPRRLPTAALAAALLVAAALLPTAAAAALWRARRGSPAAQAAGVGAGRGEERTGLLKGAPAGAPLDRGPAAA